MQKKFFTILFSVLLSLSIFLGAELLQEDHKGLSVNFFDVGQGDSALIQEGNYQVLIDGGPDEKVLTEISKIMPPLDRKIELIVLTHPHADHLVGINYLLERYEIGEIMISGVVFNSAHYLKFLEAVKSKKISLSVPAIGSSINFGQDANITFLWPGEQYKEKSIDNLNNSSLVTRICLLAKCALFLGDQEKDEQEKMLENYRKLGNEKVFESKIIKIAHHGSSTGLFPPLMDLINPSDAVISAGKDNQFGHPHQQVLDYLNKKAISIHRTDLEGTIRLKLAD